jgi:hypothetical protein
MTARGWKLKGYRPEASTVISKLRGRRSEPIKKGNTLDAEIRLCARYVAQSEVSLRALAAAYHMRLGNVKKILQGWGVDLRTRDLLPWPLLQGEAEVCGETDGTAGYAA